MSFNTMTEMMRSLFYALALFFTLVNPAQSSTPDDDQTLGNTAYADNSDFYTFDTHHPDVVDHWLDTVVEPPLFGI